MQPFTSRPVASPLQSTVSHPSIARGFRATALALAMGLVPALSVLPIVASAQDAAEAPAFDLAAGPLGTVLSQFAAAAGVTLSFESAQAQDRQSPGLQGRYSVEQGFDALLSGSGLQAIHRGGGKYVLVAAPRVDGATLLQAVKVEAAIATDGSAEQGYRSNKVSQVGPWQGRKLEETPYSITVISQDLIESLQATMPDQIFRINPTTMLSRAQYEIDNPYVMVRGFTLVTPYRDGMQGDGYGYGTTTEDVERVEVLSGLSGFLYGPGNVGGLINYVSKRPTPERMTSLTVGNNGGENWYVHGDFGGPIDSDGRLGYRLNAIHQDGDTAIDNMSIKKTFFSGTLDWHVNEALLLRVDAAHRDYEVFGNQPYWSFASGIVRPSASRIDTSISYGQPWMRQYSKVERYGVHLQWAANDVLSVRAGWRESAIEGGANAAFNAIQADGTYKQTVSDRVAEGVDPMLWAVDTSVGAAFADARFSTGFIQHKLTAGVQYVTTGQERFPNYAPDINYTDLSLEHPTYFDKPMPEPIDRGTRIKVSGSTYTTWVIGDDVTFSERWSALIGLAHSTIDRDRITGPIFPTSGYRDSAVTPTTSLIYKPLESVTTYASYMESLEQGGVAADEFNGQPVVNAGDVLEPLTSSQIEVGIKAKVGSMLLTAALFEIDKSLQYYDLADPARPRYVQDGRQVHRGIEFTAVGKATQQLTLIGGFTWLDAKVKEQRQNPALEGKRPAQTAETIAKLRAEYQIPGLPALTLVTGANYTGRQYANALNTDELQAYTLLDAGARYVIDVAQHPLTLRLEANNLTDKHYWANGSQTGMPRALVFSVNTQF